MATVYIGSDHAGLELKAALVKRLSEKGHDVHDLGPAGDKSEQARRVFDALREFDHEPVTAIWAQCPDAAGLGLAVSNRLKKAAGFHIIEV